MTPETQSGFKKRITSESGGKRLVIETGDTKITIDRKIPESFKKEDKRKRRVPEDALSTLIPLIRLAFPGETFGPDDDAFFVQFEKKRRQVDDGELPAVSYRRTLAQLRQARYSRGDVAEAVLEHFFKVRQGTAFGDINEQVFESWVSTLSGTLAEYWPKSSKKRIR